jgi:hypothetical protein
MRRKLRRPAVGPSDASVQVKAAHQPDGLLFTWHVWIRTALPIPDTFRTLSLSFNLRGPNAWRQGPQLPLDAGSLRVVFAGAREFWHIGRQEGRPADVR